MKWSLWIGKYFGIDVYLHVTFLLLLGFIGLVDWAIMPGFFVLYVALFGCVLLHEYGHALMARRYGVPTRDITLLPIGGVARLERMPDTPWQEFMVAVAGPAVNVVIAALLLPVVMWNGGLSEGFFTTLGLTGSAYEALLKVNLSLIAFNLLPAFPMDGGRVLRSLLAMRMDYARATNIAARVGQGMALVFGAVALFTGQFLLGVIAFFVWTGAAQENRYARMRGLFRNATAADAMLPATVWLEPNDTLHRALHLRQTRPQAAYPVIQAGNPVGLVVAEDLERFGASRYLAAPVSSAMRATNLHVLSADTPLEEVLSRMQAHESPVAVVERDGALAGLLTVGEIGDYLEQRATAGRPPVPQPALRVVPPPLPDEARSV